MFKRACRIVQTASPSFEVRNSLMFHFDEHFFLFSISSRHKFLQNVQKSGKRWFFSVCVCLVIISCYRCTCDMNSLVRFVCKVGLSFQTWFAFHFPAICKSVTYFLASLWMYLSLFLLLSLIKWVAPSVSRVCEKELLTLQ